MHMRFHPLSPARASYPVLEAVPVLTGETPTERVYRLKGYMVTGPGPADRVLICEGYEIRVPKEGGGT